MKKFLFLVTAAILNGGWGCRTQFWKGSIQGPFLPGLVLFGSGVSVRFFQPVYSVRNILREKSHQNLLLRNLSSFWLILKQQWTTEEISIFSNNSHLEWRAGLSDTILKGNHTGTIPAKFVSGGPALWPRWLHSCT